MVLISEMSIEGKRDID